MRASICQYVDYPKYSVFSDLVNSIALKIPIFVFTSFFGFAAAGYLAMFDRLWSASGILVKGLGETFRQKAAEDFNRDGSYRNIYISTFWASP